MSVSKRSMDERVDMTRTFAPRDLKISQKYALASAPSSVWTSTKATTPFKQPSPIVEDMIPTCDLSVDSAGSDTMAQSSLRTSTDWREQRIANSRKEVQGVMLDCLTSMKDVVAAKLGLELEDDMPEPDADSNLFILSF